MAIARLRNYPRSRSLGGELADNLDRLYDFVITTVIEANTERDVRKIPAGFECVGSMCSRDGFKPGSDEQVAENPEEFENKLGKRFEVQRRARQEELKAELKASEVKVEAPPAAEAAAESEAKIETLPEAPPPAKRPRSVAVKRLYSAF